MLGVWRAFAALPQKEFAARAKDLHRDLTNARRTRKPRRCTRWSSEPCSAVRRRARAMWSRGTSHFSASSKLALKDQKTRSAGAAVASLPEPEWESLRQALFGPTGPLAISVEMARMFLDQSQRGRLDRLNGAIEKVNATHPAAPARAMVMNDAPQLYDPHVFPARQSRPAGTGGSSAVSPPVVGERPQAFPERKWAARAGSGDRRCQEPAHGAGAGQPSLAVAFRQGAGHHAQ